MTSSVRCIWDTRIGVGRLPRQRASLCGRHVEGDERLYSSIDAAFRASVSGAPVLTCGACVEAVTRGLLAGHDPTVDYDKAFADLISDEPEWTNGPRREG